MPRYGAVATETSGWQFAVSAAPLPVHVPVHWLPLFTHLPLEQSASATQRHAVWTHAGAGNSEVLHVVTGALPVLTLMRPYAPPPPPPPPPYDWPRSAGGPPFVGAVLALPLLVPPIPFGVPGQVFVDVVSAP